MEPREQLSSAIRQLSPKRNSTQANSIDELVTEQLEHFGIDATSDYGKTLARISRRLYECHDDVHTLWQLTLSELSQLDRSERIAWFNAKKFLSFQLAKILDTHQNAFRRSYQALGFSKATQAAKGPYSVFDNVTAIFSATPVIARTATYIYACAEWIEDAFLGKELLLEIYSRLLNPTSISLANFIVDLEAGPYASEYFAWNFSSGMAAIDGTLSHLLGRDDIVISSRNIYGGAHQLIHDWYAKPGNLEVAVETFDGYDVAAFQTAWETIQVQYSERLREGRKAYLYLESPCNPHGYVHDVPAICRYAHEQGIRVILDATVGTPFLVQPLQRVDPNERPDFVIHSYTKDLTGTGTAIAGVVLGRNNDMFLPKGTSSGGISWENTMFWNVYYVKGAFLNADTAFQVIEGMRTLPGRMLTKCINTQILTSFLAAHPDIQVRCNSLPDDENHSLCQKLNFLGMPAPLFTIEMGTVSETAFQRFFDSLAPAFSHMISLGQTNTIVSCPALTTHSELSESQLRAGGIGPRTIRFAVGDEDIKDLMAYFIETARLTIDPLLPGFSRKFMPAAEVNALVESRYLQTQQQYIRSKPSFDELTEGAGRQD